MSEPVRQLLELVEALPESDKEDVPTSGFDVFADGFFAGLDAEEAAGR